MNVNEEPYAGNPHVRFCEGNNSSHNYLLGEKYMTTRQNRKSRLGIGMVAAALTACSFAAHASQETHGGNAIACASGSGPSVGLLDYFEAGLTSNRQLDLGPDSGTYMDHINYVLDRLAKVDPIAAARYRERAKSFLSEVKFLTPEEMRSIADSNDLVNPDKGCVKQQFAVQLFNLKPGQIRYQVSQDLWSRADAKTQAGLVLHEVIYRDAVEIFGQSDSDNTRYFNAQMSSTVMNQISTNDYYAIVKASFPGNSCAFSYYAVDGAISLCISDSESDNNGDYYSIPQGARILTDQGMEIKVRKKTYVTFQKGKLTDAGRNDGDFDMPPLMIQGSPLKLNPPIYFKESAGFHPVTGMSGSLKDGEVLHIVGGRNGSEPQKLLINGLHVSLRDDVIKLYDNGMISSRLFVDGNQALHVGSQDVPLADGSAVTLLPDGKVQTFTLGSDTSFQVAGKSILAKAGAEISLDDQGAILSISAIEKTEFQVGTRSFEFSSIGFSPDGKIVSGDISRNEKIVFDDQKFDLNKKWSTTIWFYESGEMEAFFLNKKNMSLPVGNGSVDFKQEFSSTLLFYPDGKLGVMLDRNNFIVNTHASPLCEAAGLSAEQTNRSTSQILDRTGGVCYSEYSIRDKDRAAIEKALVDLNK